MQPDWKNNDSYSDLSNASGSEWAWEFLRRNPRYRAAYIQRLNSTASQQEPAEQPADPADFYLKDWADPQLKYDKKAIKFKSCPCGCGAELPINLDPQAGPAWRLYKNSRLGNTVFPSIWRDTDCGSHFIIWRDNIHLFGRNDDHFAWIATDAEKSMVVEAVRKRLEVRLVPYVQIADQLGEIPWDVLQACRELVRRGVAREGSKAERGKFALV